MTDSTKLTSSNPVTDEPLAHVVDRFDCVQIQSDQLPTNPDLFKEILRKSLVGWRENKHKLVWLEVTIDQSYLIAPATDEGFTFHHSTQRSLTLLYTLSITSTVPTDATHYLGIGGVVLNSQEQLLVVSEKHRRDLTRPYWKLPGGALMPGEHLEHAVLREVYEETGVNAEFEALVGFRHWHGYRWNISDVYFIARLRAHNSEITPQEDEIDEAKWMDVREYLDNEHVSAFNKRAVRAALQDCGVSPEKMDGYADEDRYEFFMPTNGEF